MSRPLCLFLFLLLLMAARSTGERINNTATGPMLVSAPKDEAELVQDSGVVLGDQDQIDGGFSSLDGMLHWAIGHSDPAKLKESAQDVERLSTDELQRRQLELKELLEKLKMPSDAQLMQIAISDLKNSSLSLEGRHRALEDLLVLVEPLDNANDLSKLGGLSVVVEQLNHLDPDVRRLSAWVLGTASQNNPVVQFQVLQLGALTTLIKMVKSSFVEEAVKAMYAVSTVIRNNVVGQDMFYAENGHIMLRDVMSNSSMDIRLRRKAVFLVGDLAEGELENTERSDQPFLSNVSLMKAVVDLIASLDLDLQEKALVTLKNLLQLKGAEGMVLREIGGLEGALERMKVQLQESMEDEFKREYAADVESLRAEVESIFRRRLHGQ